MAKAGKRAPGQDKPSPAWVATLRPLCEAACVAAGVDLYELAVRGSRRSPVIEVTIETGLRVEEGVPKSGVNFGHCSAVTRQLEAAIDALPDPPGDYRIDVLSPGIDRELPLGQDWRAYVGCALRVWLSPAQILVPGDASEETPSAQGSPGSEPEAQSIPAESEQAGRGRDPSAEADNVTVLEGRLLCADHEALELETSTAGADAKRRGAIRQGGRQDPAPRVVRVPRQAVRRGKVLA